MTEKNADAMNENNVKVIDLYDVLKFLWHSKLVILIAMLVMIGVAVLGVNRNVQPAYMTSILVRMPQYVDDRTVNTAVAYATGDMLANVYVEQHMDLGNPAITVEATPVKGSTIVRVQFTGTDPEAIKAFSDVYQTAFINGVNQFVNESVLSNLAVLQGSNLERTLTPSTTALPTGKAEVIKMGAVPTANLNAGVKTKNIVKFAVFGFILGCGISLIRYGWRILK